MHDALRRLTAGGRRCACPAGTARRTRSHRYAANAARRIRASDTGHVRAPDDLVQLDLIADREPVLEDPLGELLEIDLVPDGRDEERSERAVRDAAIQPALADHVAHPLVVDAVLDDELDLVALGQMVEVRPEVALDLAGAGARSE